MELVIGQLIDLRVKYKGIADRTGDLIYIENGCYDEKGDPVELIVHKSIVLGPSCKCTIDGIVWNCPTHGHHKKIIKEG